MSSVEDVGAVQRARLRGIRPPSCAARVRDQRRDIEALLVVDAALPVGDGDDLGALVASSSARDRADVAEALHGDAGALQLEAEMLRRLARDDHHAAAGRLAPAERSAHLDRLAGDDGRRRCGRRAWNRCPRTRP